MKAAYKQALLAYKLDEVPIGCVIVKENKIIAKAHNQKEKKNCALYHAEIECILKACKKLNNWNLKGCTMYVTLEPCMMCTGAIINSRLDEVYYATDDLKGGCLNSNIKLLEIKKLNHYPKIHQGLLAQEASQLLKDFFKEKRSVTK